MRCGLCGGCGSIRLNLHHVIQPEVDLSPVVEVPRDAVMIQEQKTYPCPECRQVFYRSDLIQVHAVEPVVEAFKDQQSYKDHLNSSMAARLGRQALKHGELIRFSLRENVPELDHRPDARSVLVSDMFIVKKTAAGWRPPGAQAYVQATDEEHRAQPQGPGGA